MIRTLFSLILLITCAQLQGQTFKILTLNTPSINIGGKSLKVNETFSAADKVNWASGRQAMKVLDMDKGTQRLLVAEQFAKSRVETIKDYLTKNNHLSTRDGELNNTIALGSYLKDTFYLLDSIDVATKIPTDDKRFFYISFDYKGEEINKRIACTDGTFSITRDIFSIDGQPIEPFDTYIRVYYYDTAAGKLTLVSDRMRIVVLPQSS